MPAEIDVREDKSRDHARDPQVLRHIAAAGADEPNSTKAENDSGGISRAWRIQHITTEEPHLVCDCTDVDPPGAHVIPDLGKSKPLAIPSDAHCNL